jgi:Electron transfer DM13
MKKLLLGLWLLSSWSCVKDMELTPTQEMPLTDLASGKVEVLGTFKAGAHPTSGMVRIVSEANNANKKYLVFSNFTTDPGPDLRIYLAQDTRATNFVELEMLTKTGNFSVEIPESSAVGNPKYVLIWCKRFAVLFGSAQLN